MAVGKKKAMCARLGTPGQTSRNWPVCSCFPSSAAHSVFSPLCKRMWELHVLGLRTQAEKHPLPWLSPMAVLCFLAWENVLDRS